MGSTPTPNGRPSQEQLALRRQFVFEKRRDNPGISLRTIATEAKVQLPPGALPPIYTEREVWADIKYMYKRITRKLEDVAEVQLQEDLELIDWCIRSLAPRVNAGEAAAVREVRGLMERRAQMVGLDKPFKVAPVDPDGITPYNPAAGMTDDQIQDAVGRLLAQKPIGELISPFKRATEEERRLPHRRYPGPEEVGVFDTESSS